METFLAGATNSKTPPVVLKSMEVVHHLAQERVVVRSTGETAGADLMIWCTNDAMGAEIHFELLTQRAAPEVYEPPTLSMPAQPVDRSQRAALGVINYLRRDYVGSEPMLRTAVDMSSETEAAAALTLLIGNAQAFRRVYEAAATTYNTAVKSEPGWAFAWHNLGVAELYAAWSSHRFDKALAAFDEARALDPGFDLSLISMARIYRWTYDEVPGNYEKAFTACAQAEQSRDANIRTQGAICTNLTKMLIGGGSNSGATPPQIGSRKALEDAAAPYWAEPLALIGIVQNAYWSTNHDPVAREQARTYFARYLRDAYDDLHLEDSRQLYSDVADAYLLLRADAIAP